MREFRMWSKRFGLGFSHGIAPPTRGFNLEYGAHRLEPWFADVRMERCQDELVVKRVEPLMAYIQSTAAGKCAASEQLARAREFFQHLIDTEGAVHIAKDTGLFRAVRRSDMGMPS
jgi:hypothetical protein